MTLTHSPIMRISCGRAGKVNLGDQTRPGVLISSDDLKILRLLSGRDISVTLWCDGHLAYEGQVKAILRRIVYLADRNRWYIPTTPTGPLKPPRLPPLVE
jgi:hypothetical protein